MSSSAYPRLAREFLWIGLGQAFAVLGMIVGVRLLTGLLDPMLYGELALAMTAVALIQQVIMGPLSNASQRFFSAAEESGESRAYVAGLRVLTIRGSAGILTAAGLISLGIRMLAGSQRALLAVFAFIFALISGLNSVLDGIQNAARQRAVVAWHNALSSWARFLLAVGLVIWIGPRSAVAMLGYALASIMVLASQLFFFKRKILAFVGGYQERYGQDISNKWEGILSSYAWPFATWGVFTWAQMASARWALEIFSSTHDVGLFAVVYQLGYYPMMIIGGLIFQLAVPVLFRRAGDASDSARVAHARTMNRRLILAGALAAVLATAVAFFLSKPMFGILVDSRYQSGSWLMPGLVLSGGFFSVGQFCSIHLMISSESKKLMFPKITIAVFEVLLNMSGAYLFGLIGIVGASLVASMAYMIWISLIVNRGGKPVAGAYRPVSTGVGETV